MVYHDHGRGRDRDGHDGHGLYDHDDGDHGLHAKLSQQARMMLVLMKLE